MYKRQAHKRLPRASARHLRKAAVGHGGAALRRVKLHRRAFVKNRYVLLFQPAADLRLLGAAGGLRAHDAAPDTLLLLGIHVLIHWTSPSFRLSLSLIHI